MEEQRLKPMGDYDPQLFNLLYKKVNPLKRKLASEIDHRRFGVDYEELLSWFDIKFIYVFNKYHKQENPDVLLGYILNSLKLYKCRILRAAYTTKFSQSISSLTYESVDYIPEETDTSMVKSIMEFLKIHLSDNAYEYFIVTNYPPPYIVNQIEKLGISHKTKIPDEIVMDYYNIRNVSDGHRWIRGWKNEIKKTIELAKAYFNKA